jgi:integron integrase
MKKGEIENRVRAVCRTRHWSYKTEVAYLAQIRRFMAFLATPGLPATSEGKVRAFLEGIAPHVAAKTQNQALNAIVFLYRDVLEQPLGELGSWSRAKVPRRLPVWLSMPELRRVFALSSGTHSLMLRLAYGCGMRLMEVCRLRVQHVDLERRTVTIMGAKGDKDRTVALPEALVAELGAHFQRVRALWEGDAARGLPPVALPGTLESKYPNAGREWCWFWVFPGRNLSRDPRSGIIRRHHAHEDGLSKHLKAAVRRAGISKRVTMHVLRHSFATHQLERGVPLHKLRDALGHNDISTTEIYLHVLPREVASIGSPLDDMQQSPVVPFPPALARSATA